MSEFQSEWNAAQKSAALFDISQRGLVELSGPDAATFLHNLCTNDIKNLAAGKGCEFFLTTNKAKVVARGFAHRLLPAESAKFWLDLDPQSAAKVVAHLDHFLVSEQVEIADRTGLISQFHVCGPQAPTVLSNVFPNLPPLENLEHSIATDVRFIRHDRLSLPGYDLFFPAGSKAARFREQLISAGAVPGSPATYNTLRIEAGVPEDGIDIDAERFVVEVGRIKEAICYTKGCYLGQEPIVMARDRGHANRALLGLKIDSPEPLPRGTKVTQNGQEVGELTSSTWSPLMGSVIALAYLKRGSQEPGTFLQANGHPATVSFLPFNAQ